LSRRRDALRNRLIEARETTDRGRGIFALSHFAPGTVVCAFRGKRIKSTDDAVEAMYAVDLGGGYSLMPDIGSVGGHLANHSCSPNTALRRLPSPARNAFGLIAREPIWGNDEVTLYYGWHWSSDPCPCRCGETCCAGSMAILGPDADGSIDAHVRAAVKNRNLGALNVVVAAIESQGPSDRPLGARERVKASVRSLHAAGALTDKDVETFVRFTRKHRTGADRPPRGTGTRPLHGLSRGSRERSFTIRRDGTGRSGTT
jgi:hypothetical protein